MPVYKVEICGVNTSKLPLLTNEEKDALFMRIAKGDKSAREQYIKGNLRLVLSVVFLLLPTSQLESVAQIRRYDILFVLSNGNIHLLSLS